MTVKRLDTAAEFLRERQDFLYVYAVPSSSGAGWDVVVRMDGTYTEKAEAIAASAGIKALLCSLSDVPLTEAHWWNGAPWLRQEQSNGHLLIMPTPDGGELTFNSYVLEEGRQWQLPDDRTVTVVREPYAEVTELS